MDERKLSSTMQSAELTPFQKLKIKKIEDTIDESSKALANHKIYTAIETIEDLRIFMAHHIYCVWDFMNLIKVGFLIFLKKLSDDYKSVQKVVYISNLGSRDRHAKPRFQTSKYRLFIIIRFKNVINLFKNLKAFANRIHLLQGSISSCTKFSWRTSLPLSKWNRSRGRIWWAWRWIYFSFCFLLQR